jgi:outer membrane lipoprotein-sorting protein
MIRFSAVVLLVALPLTIGAVAGDVHSIAQGVDEHYNHLRTLQAEFTEVYRGSGMERTESGDGLAGEGWDEKTWQDAVGIPFSQGEALRE